MTKQNGINSVAPKKNNKTTTTKKIKTGQSAQDVLANAKRVIKKATVTIENSFNPFESEETAMGADKPKIAIPDILTVNEALLLAYGFPQGMSFDAVVDAMEAHLCGEETSSIPDEIVTERCEKLQDFMNTKRLLIEAVSLKNSESATLNTRAPCLFFVDCLKRYGKKDLAKRLNNVVGDKELGAVMSSMTAKAYRDLLSLTFPEMMMDNPSPSTVFTRLDRELSKAGISLPMQRTAFIKWMKTADPR